jgi:hypothetical protein
MDRSKWYTMTAIRYTWIASDPNTYGSSPTYTEGDSFPCIIDQLSQNESLSNQKEIAESTHYLECPYSVTLDIKDRIICEGITYDITAIDNPMNMDVCWEILLKERK